LPKEDSSKASKSEKKMKMFSLECKKKLLRVKFLGRKGSRIRKLILICHDEDKNAVSSRLGNKCLIFNLSQNSNLYWGRGGHLAVAGMSKIFGVLRLELVHRYGELVLGRTRPLNARFNGRK
jgi:hypothetical protein